MDILLKHQMLTFHGVLMEHNGCGIIISAPSGTGKTTHARMWRDSRNALIINGDRATCQNINGVWTGFGLPWSGTSGEQINRSVPITAIVVLEQGETNQARQITSPLEAFMMLLPHVQYPSWDKEMTSKAMDLLEDFLKEIPVIRLSCLPDLEAVDVLEKAIEQFDRRKKMDFCQTSVFSYFRAACREPAGCFYCNRNEYVALYLPWKRSGNCRKS